MKSALLLKKTLTAFICAWAFLCVLNSASAKSSDVACLQTQEFLTHGNGT